MNTDDSWTTQQVMEFRDSDITYWLCVKIAAKDKQGSWTKKDYRFRG